MKKTIWIIITGVLVLAGVFIFKKYSQTKAIMVTTETAQKRNIIEAVSANGKIQPEVEVKISSDVSGEIIELFVKEGDQVKRGDILCKINPLIYESNLSRMEATLNGAKANLANSKARLEQVRASFINAEGSFLRNKKLLEQGAVSQSDFDIAKAVYDGAVAEMMGAEENVNASDYNVKSTEASLKEASDNLARTTIFSPVNATVSKLNREKGERVVGTAQFEGTEIMRLANLNEMEVSVDVNENDIVRVNTGDTTLIEVDAYIDRKFKGIVTEIANSANTTGVTAEQVTNFTVKIRILQESYQDLIDTVVKSAPFRPGMSATVDIQTKKAENIISVPIQSVTTRSDSTAFKEKEMGKKTDEEEIVVVNNSNKNSKKELKDVIKVEECVFLFIDGKAKMVKVKTGIQDNNYIEIIEGVKVGDELVSGPYSAISKQLKEGAELKKVDKSELFSGNKK